MSETVVLALTFMLIPALLIFIVALFYYRTYNQRGDAVTRDPATAWNALRGGISALLEIIAVIAIATMVFVLTWQKIITAELAAAFYSGLIGYLVGSSRARISPTKD